MSRCSDGCGRLPLSPMTVADSGGTSSIGCFVRTRTRLRPLDAPEWRASSSTMKAGAIWGHVRND